MLRCFVFGHQYHVIQEFDPNTRCVCCLRCRKLWAVDGPAYREIDWVRDASLYADHFVKHRETDIDAQSGVGKEVSP